MPDWYCEWQVWGTNTRSPRQGRTAGVGSVKGPSLGRTGTSEMRRFWPFAGTAIHPTGPRLAVIRRCSSNRPDREQHGGQCYSRYNRVEGTVRKGSEVSPMPKSTFTDPQQIIADLRRELAECRADRDDTLAQQIATGRVLQVINLSPGELAPVFESDRSPDRRETGRRRLE